MNIGIRLHDVAPGTLEERARIARQQGFTCVHLALSKTVGPELMNPAAATPGLACSVRRMLDGLDIAVLGCYLNLTHPDGEAYREILRKYQAHIRLAAWMGAGVVGTETGAPNAQYRYDPTRSHSPEALEMFIRRLAPVVECAERFGVTVAIEPVYTHIVYCPQAARTVLDTLRSDHLKIIFDPVNLLHSDNADRHDAVIQEAIDLLGEEIMVIHMKDFLPPAEPGGPYGACACGLGGMKDYSRILRFARDVKPYVQITLENTRPDNAEKTRLFLENYLEK